MPHVAPFHGIRYSSSSDLGDLVCPPYDVISAEEQVALHDRHPNNAIRLELAKTDYEDAGRAFDRWQEEGVLKTDDRPSLYVYRQDFTADDGRRRRVAGVMGALRLEEFGPDSGVLPHERTMPGPKKDRMALMRALQANVSPIYAIYRGGGGLGPYLQELESRPTEARFADGAGVLHRLWVINAPAEVEMLTDALGAQPLVIADGHHRYETALEYAREKGGSGPHERIMCFCVDADAEELVVLPYNRVLKTARSAADATRVLKERFAGRSVDRSDGERLLGESKAAHPFLFVFPGETVLAEVRDEQVVETVGERPRAWRDLDVVALHEVVLPAAFPEGVDELRFTKDPSEIARAVDEEGWSAGILLPALTAPQIVDAAETGERMPQKASYFWPKAITGLAFRSLR